MLHTVCTWGAGVCGSQRRVRKQEKRGKKVWNRRGSNAPVLRPWELLLNVKSLRVCGEAGVSGWFHVVCDPRQNGRHIRGTCASGTSFASVNFLSSLLRVWAPLTQRSSTSPDVTLEITSTSFCRFPSCNHPDV